jgi:hypothetical protein
MKISFRIFGVTISFGLWTIHKILLAGIVSTLLARWFLESYK